MQKRDSQRQHDLLVRRSVGVLVSRNFYNIRADIRPLQQPAAIATPWFQGPEREAIPDLAAEGDRPYIFEVETADSITHEHTGNQWSLFSQHAARHSVGFAVIVPLGAGPAAQRRLRELRVSAEIWEI